MRIVDLFMAVSNQMEGSQLAPDWKQTFQGTLVVLRSPGILFLGLKMVQEPFRSTGKSNHIGRSPDTGIKVKRIHLQVVNNEGPRGDVWEDSTPGVDPRPKIFQGPIAGLYHTKWRVRNALIGFSESWRLTKCQKGGKSKGKSQFLVDLQRDLDFFSSA